MGIFSKSLNLLSKSVSKVTSLPISSNVSGDMKRRYKLNYLISRMGDGQVHYTRMFSPDQQHLHYEDIDFPNTKRTPDFLPYASCKSLLFSCNNDDGPLYALWNPTTDEFKSLPKLTVNTNVYIFSFGLGFDPASQDYKVVRFLDFVYDRYVQVGLYSLESGSWKEIACPKFPAVPIVKQPSVHINGFSYWVTPNSIISFDFANEIFSTAPHIPLPETDKLEDVPMPSNCLLAEYDGSLAALVYTYSHFRNGGKPFDFEIWVWKDEVWDRVLVSEINDSVHVLKPLGLFNNDEFYFQDSDYRLFLFHCAKRELINLGLKADCSEVSILPYVKCVMPIKASECQSGRS